MRRTSIILIAAVLALLSAHSVFAGAVAVHDWSIEVPGGWLGYVEWGSFDPTVTVTHRYFYFGPLGQVETSIGPVAVAVGASLVVCTLIAWAVVVVRRRSRSRVVHAPNAA